MGGELTGGKRSDEITTLSGLGVDTRDITVVELVGESGDALRSGVRRLRVRDRGEAVPYGEIIFVRQSSTSPVAPGWTIDDDSNGSMPLVRLTNLVGTI